SDHSLIGSLRFGGVNYAYATTFESAEVPGRQLKLWSKSSPYWTPYLIPNEKIAGLPPHDTFEMLDLFGGTPDLMYLTVSINGAAPTIARYDVVATGKPQPYFDPTRPFVTAPLGTSGAIIVGFDPAGQLICARRDF